MLLNNAGESTGRDIESLIECSWRYFQLVKWLFFAVFRCVGTSYSRMDQVKGVEGSLSRPYLFNFGCIPQILLGPFLNTLTCMSLQVLIQGTFDWDGDTSTGEIPDSIESLFPNFIPTNNQKVASVKVLTPSHLVSRLKEKKITSNFILTFLCGTSKSFMKCENKSLTFF